MILALIAMLEATSAFYGYAGYGYGHRAYGYGHRYGYGYPYRRRAEVDNVSGELEVPTEEVPRRRGYWGRRRGYYPYSRPYAPAVDGSEDKKPKKTEEAADVSAYGHGYRRAEEDVPEDEIPEEEIEVAPERLPIEVSLATPIQRHPEDCTVYFIYNIPYQCPEGMAFDMKDLVCVEEDAADCPRPTPCDLKTSRE